MKTITISEKVFDEIFDNTLKELKAQKYEANEDGAPVLFRESPLYKSDVDSVHRWFHYTVCKLKEKLKDA